MKKSELLQIIKEEISKTLNEKNNTTDVYSFIKQNLNTIKKSLNIKNISEFDGDENIAHIDDDINYIVWNFAFDPSILKDIESLVEKININGKILYYVEGKG